MEAGELLPGACPHGIFFKRCRGDNAPASRSPAARRALCCLGWGRGAVLPPLSNEDAYCFGSSKTSDARAKSATTAYVHPPHSGYLQGAFLLLYWPLSLLKAQKRRQRKINRPRQRRSFAEDFPAFR